jgi:hypothetical protein
MRSDEKTLIDQASATIDRIRRITVKLRASWTRLDDLPAEAGTVLKRRLQAALDGWAEAYGMEQGEIQTDGPKIETYQATSVIHLDI